MARTADYAAVYEVSSDSERTRVAGVLEGFGIRVQMTSFESVSYTHLTLPTN